MTERDYYGEFLQDIAGRAVQHNQIIEPVEEPFHQSPLWTQCYRLTKEQVSWDIYWNKVQQTIVAVVSPGQFMSFHAPTDGVEHAVECIVRDLDYCCEERKEMARTP